MQQAQRQVRKIGPIERIGYRRTADRTDEDGPLRIKRHRQGVSRGLKIEIGDPGVQFEGSKAPLDLPGSERADGDVKALMALQHRFGEMADHRHGGRDRAQP